MLFILFCFAFLHEITVRKFMLSLLVSLKPRLLINGKLTIASTLLLSACYDIKEALAQIDWRNDIFLQQAKTVTGIDMPWLELPHKKKVCITHYPLTLKSSNRYFNIKVFG